LSLLARNAMPLRWVLTVDGGRKALIVANIPALALATTQ
jgi:hypothetical protein